MQMQLRLMNQFGVMVFVFLLANVFAIEKSDGDDFQCPTFVKGTYPDKFQTSGNNSSIWTLEIEGGGFVTISSGVTWVHRSVSRTAGTPKLICEGYVNGSNQPIKVYYPVYFSSYWTCAPDNYGNYFTCNIK